jgi:ubiquinone/menaquinone biosynthesis C-methylase UbiE
MSIRQAYNQWAEQYDTNNNKTRDAEATALRTMLQPVSFGNCLEIGCGTGKNTEWLLQKATLVTAVDFSEAMLTKASQKIKAAHVQFRQADITHPWNFGSNHYQLVTFSLVLEHIEHLEPILKEAAAALTPGGYVYIGELHPFKQYSGSKARFDTEAGRQVLQCYTHHVSDFIQAALKNKLQVINLKEHFDTADKTELPRIITILLQKKASES